MADRNTRVRDCYIRCSRCCNVPYGRHHYHCHQNGRNDKEGAYNAFMTAFSLTIPTAVILTVVRTVLSQQIVDLSGARKLAWAFIYQSFLRNLYTAESAVGADPLHFKKYTIPRNNQSVFVFYIKSITNAACIFYSHYLNRIFGNSQRFQTSTALRK